MKKILILFTLCGALFNGCKKENDYTGKLVLEFEVVPRSGASIYSFEDPSTYLMDIDINENKKTITLNAGNYSCVVSETVYETARINFQIQPNNTTRIVYKKNERPVVKY